MRPDEGGDDEQVIQVENNHIQIIFDLKDISPGKKGAFVHLDLRELYHYNIGGLIRLSKWRAEEFGLLIFKTGHIMGD